MSYSACVQCGRSFDDLPVRAHRKFCSTACRNQYNNAVAKSRAVQSGEHGKRVGYARGCRCKACRAYNAGYSKARRDKEPKRPRRTRSDKGIERPRSSFTHGTVRGYGVFRCRCIECRLAAIAYNTKWRKANPETYRAGQYKFRLSHRRGSHFTPEAIEYVEIIRRDPCVYCGGKCTAIDHIEPVILGGGSEWTNLEPICGSCNSRKGKKRLLNFLLYIAA